MKEYEDIGQSREWQKIEFVYKGWSDDRKYKVMTDEGEDLLLKIADIEEFPKKKKEFEIVKSLEDKKLIMPKAIDIGVCNNEQSIYSLYTWINGNDAEVEMKKFSREKQYEFGVIAGKYLKNFLGTLLLKYPLIYPEAKSGLIFTHHVILLNSSQGSP